MSKTKSGVMMRTQLKRRVIAVLSDPACDHLKYSQVAKLIKISERTLRDYLTDEVKAEIERLRRGEMNTSDLCDVDRAMLVRAKEGSVAAAKLIYARLAGVADDHNQDLPDLAEIEQELQQLRKADTQA